MTIYVDGRPIPGCPRCGAHLPRWNREQLVDQADRPRVLHTLECLAPGCGWCSTLEQHLVNLRPPRKDSPHERATGRTQVQAMRKRAAEPSRRGPEMDTQSPVPEVLPGFLRPDGVTQSRPSQLR